MRVHAPRHDVGVAVEALEPAAAPGPIHLDLASRLDVLQQVQASLSGLLAAAGVDADDAVNIGVAVQESVVNAIKHGGGGDARKHVRVSMAVVDRVLDVNVADEGRGFDPDSLPDPFAPENLLKPDGRGMLMMRSFMDDVEFSFPASGGTVVRLRKRL